MRNLNRFWQSLERVPGPKDVPAFWEAHCESDYDLMRPHLRATDTIGSLYPCPHPSSGHCPRRIVDCGNGQYAAICRDPHRVCSDVALAPREVLVHELDIAGLLQRIAAPIGLRFQQPVPRGDGTWAVGTSSRGDTRGQPVFLIILPETARFRVAVERLMFNVPGPFVILAPTSRHRDVALQEHLQRRGLGFLALDDVIGLSGDGQFAPIEAAEATTLPRPTPKEDRARVIREFTTSHKCKVKDIQVAAGVDEADYYKWLHGRIPDHYSTCTAIERVLRIGIPKPAKR